MGFFNLYFRVSELKIIAATIGIFITLLTMFIASKQLKDRLKTYYLINIVFIFAFLLMFFTKNWILFIVSWELLTVSTALMLLWKNRGLAGQYMIIQFMGTALLIFAIIMAIINGYNEIGPIKEIWLQNMLILGLGMKSAVFGLHFWLPAVHSQAPAPVSAILSGWVVKLGFIMYLRIITGGNMFLFILGFMMVFYGGIKALRAEDYKVLLAYSSISQLGFIAIGIGSGTVYGFLGALLHMLAHSLSKSGLFIGSGYLLKWHGSRSIYNFGESWKRPFIINMNILVGFGSLMGFPILTGFNSKCLIKYSFYGEQVFNLNSLMPESLGLIKINKLALLGSGDVITYFLYAGGLLTGLYSLRFLYWGLFRGWNLSKIKERLYRSISLFNYNRNVLNGKNHGNNKANRVNRNVDAANRNEDKLNRDADTIGNYRISYGESFVLFFIVILLFVFGFNPGLIIDHLQQIDISFNLVSGLIEFIIITVIALIILQRMNWLKITGIPIPSLDLFFNKVNKKIHQTSRLIYKGLYQDFQYQLLWIPLFIIILFGLMYLGFQ
ncbi:MAG: complex I subunit 5 family protein [Halanaerobiales bacterium]